MINENWFTKNKSTIKQVIAQAERVKAAEKLAKEKEKPKKKETKPRSIKERAAIIIDKGPDRWLTTTLFENPEPEQSRASQQRAIDNSRLSAQNQRSLDLGDHETALQGLQSFITNHGAKARGSGLLANATKMLNTLNGPNRNQLLDTMGYTQEYERRIKDEWDSLSQINNITDGRRFLEEGLGYQKNASGLYVPGQIGLGMRERHSMPLDNRNKGYRGLQFRSLLRLLDPEVQERLRNGNLTEIQKRSITNPQLSSDAWNIAGELQKEMSPGLLSTWDKLGGPDSMRLALNPNIPVEWLLSGDSPTGLTNIDMLRTADPEAYEQQFGTRADRRRGQFQLAKTLITGGKDQLLDLPDFLSEATGVVDHSEGRSQDNTDGIPKEAPIKQLLTANDVNWAKADSPDEQGNKDTIPGLIRRAESFQDGSIGGLRNVDGSDEDQLKLLWLANRLLGVDLNRTEEEPVISPTSLAQVADMDNDMVKRLVDKDNLNIRNLSMYYPRLSHGPYDQNSWSGAMGTGNRREYYPILDGVRRPLIASAFMNPEIQQNIADKRSELSAAFNGDEDKIEKGMKKFINQLISLRIQMPLQSAASTWTTGLSSTDEWIDRLKTITDDAMIGLPQDEESAQRILKARDESLKNYKDDIRSKGFMKIPRVSDDWLVDNLGSNPVVNMGFSNYGRSKLPEDFLNDHFDPAMLSGQIPVPFGTGTTPAKLRDRPFVGGSLLFDVAADKFSESLTTSDNLL